MNHVLKILPLIQNYHSHFHVKICNRLLIKYRPFPVLSPVSPLNLIIPYHLSCFCLHWTCPVETPYIPRCRHDAHFPLLTSFQSFLPSPRPRVTFLKDGKTPQIWIFHTSFKPVHALLHGYSPGLTSLDCVPWHRPRQGFKWSYIR